MALHISKFLSSIVFFSLHISNFVLAPHSEVTGRCIKSHRIHPHNFYRQTFLGIPLISRSGGRSHNYVPAIRQRAVYQKKNMPASGGGAQALNVRKQHPPPQFPPCCTVGPLDIQLTTLLNARGFLRWYGGTGRCEGEISWNDAKAGSRYGVNMRALVLYYARVLVEQSGWGVCVPEILSFGLSMY